MPQQTAGVRTIFSNVFGEINALVLGRTTTRVKLRLVLNVALKRREKKDHELKFDTIHRLIIISKERRETESLTFVHFAPRTTALKVMSVRRRVRKINQTCACSLIQNIDMLQLLTQIIYSVIYYSSRPKNNLSEGQCNMIYNIICYVYIERLILFSDID